MDMGIGMFDAFRNTYQNISIYTVHLHMFIHLQSFTCIYYTPILVAPLDLFLDVTDSSAPTCRGQFVGSHVHHASTNHTTNEGAGDDGHDLDGLGPFLEP